MSTLRKRLTAALVEHGVDAETELLDSLEAAVKAHRAEARSEQSELIEAFCELTHLAAPAPATAKERKAAAELWYQPCRRLVELADGESLSVVRAAVERMRGQSLTIYSPKSVEKVATAIWAERYTQGRTPGARAARGEDWGTRLDDYLSRRADAGR